MYEITQTPNFSKWYSKQEIAIKIIVDARFKRIKDAGELGDVRYLGNKIFEFKWKIGNGGKKDDQKRDIKKARSIQKDYYI